MVVFTCQNCGESLQKPKVEKHLQFMCRHSPLLTCVDCHKDFRGNEYVGHTQCLTELERYSAKGFIPKPNSQKGLTKQNLWNDMIKHVLKHKDLGITERRLLNTVCMLPNIPRKRAKFQNFMENTTGCTHTLADTVFKLLETEWLEFSKNREGEDVLSVVSGNGKCDSVKNSEKQNTVEVQGKSVNNPEEVCSEGEIIGKNCYISDDVKQLSKKEKKQKHKRDKYVEEINSIENNKYEENKEMNEINSHKKAKKKRKTSNKDMGEENVNGKMQEELLEGGSQKKKKKKHNDYSHGHIQTSTSKNLKIMQSNGTDHMAVEEQEEREAKDKTGTIFNWSDTIIQVLQSQSNRELSLKRLSRKVLAEYRTMKGDELHESYEKLMAKFNKKVYKTLGVKVIKDRAKLMT